jgi:hypothetical protein
MNDPDNFFSRWSHRKQEASQRKEKKEEAPGETPAESASEPEAGGTTFAPEKATGSKSDSESLPLIESINAETDVTAFMRTGVPETLKHAALRRAWSSDPAIRDFVGLNENFWDAAGPDGIPGFGDLDPNLDVKRLVSELFGEAPRQDALTDPEASQAADPSTPPTAEKSGMPIPPRPALASAAESLPQRNENAAAQIEPTESVPEKKIPRRHGGAMPR